MCVNICLIIVFYEKNQCRLKIAWGKCDSLFCIKYLNFHRFRYNFERSLDVDNTLGYKSSWTHSHNCNNRVCVRIPRLRYRILCLGVGLLKVDLADASCEQIQNCKCFADTVIERQIVTRVLTAMQSLYLHLWGEKGSRPYMQSFHFAYSIGALLAPVVGKWFRLILLIFVVAMVWNDMYFL